uniref:Uncharacterized protein n=1 Tax=Anopheles minimus TaxID=112268 RepID=A0A182WIT1_9DIPT
MIESNPVPTIDGGDGRFSNTEKVISVHIPSSLYAESFGEGDPPSSVGGVISTRSGTEVAHSVTREFDGDGYHDLNGAAEGGSGVLYYDTTTGEWVSSRLREVGYGANERMALSSCDNTLQNIVWSLCVMELEERWQP